MIQIQHQKRTKLNAKKMKSQGFTLTKTKYPVISGRSSSSSLESYLYPCQTFSVIITDTINPLIDPRDKLQLANFIAFFIFPGIFWKKMIRLFAWVGLTNAGNMCIIGFCYQHNHYRSFFNQMKLPSLSIAGLTAQFPLIQGGMSIRVSTSSLAAPVANCGGMV